MLIALCGQKGGSGKTTVAIAIAAELLARGKRVLLVDADPQGTARTWADVAAEAGRPVPTVVVMGAKMHLPGQLDSLAANYDHTVIDCPPRHGDVQRSALMVADVAVLPAGGGGRRAGHDRTGRDHRGGAQDPPRPARVRARDPPRRPRGDRRRGSAESRLPRARRTKTELGFRIAYQEAPAAGLGVAQYAPRSAAAAEIRTLVNELLEVQIHGKKTKHRAKKTAGR